MPKNFPLLDYCVYINCSLPILVSLNGNVGANNWTHTVTKSYNNFCFKFFLKKIEINQQKINKSLAENFDSKKLIWGPSPFATHFTK